MRLIGRIRWVSEKETSDGRAQVYAHMLDSETGGRFSCFTRLRAADLKAIQDAPAEFEIMMDERQRDDQSYWTSKTLDRVVRVLQPVEHRNGQLHPDREEAAQDLARAGLR